MKWMEETNRIYACNAHGVLVAQVTFPEISNGVCAIDHTFVDESLRGQGMADQLLQAVARKLTRENRRVKPVCSYAVHWFHKHEEFQYLLENA